MRSTCLLNTPLCSFRMWKKSRYVYPPKISHRYKPDPCHVWVPECHSFQTFIVKSSGDSWMYPYQRTPSWEIPNYKPYKYHGYTVRGTPNCPWKSCRFFLLSCCRWTVCLCCCCFLLGKQVNSSPQRMEADTCATKRWSNRPEKNTVERTRKKPVEQCNLLRIRVFLSQYVCQIFRLKTWNCNVLLLHVLFLLGKYLGDLWCQVLPTQIVVCIGPRDSPGVSRHFGDCPTCLGFFLFWRISDGGAPFLI